MRKIPVLIASLVLPGLLAAAAPARAHPAIEIRTYADTDGDGVGDPVRTKLDSAKTVGAKRLDGSEETLLAGPPVSPKQSCGLCHSYEKITSAYHFQLGLDERVDTDGDGFADDLGKVLAGPGGALETLPTLYHISSPGQFGAW